MQLSFVTNEKGLDGTRRTITEIDKKDHETILWSFSQVLDLHRALEAPEPPLETVALYRQPERISWLVDDVGLIFAVFDKPGRASVHICFWDRRLRGRETLCRGLADWLIHKFHLRYLYTSIPFTSGPTLEFAKRIGFEPVEYTKDHIVNLVYLTEVVSP
jgi:hypothetical protein